ncbi:MAG: helix-turn-helix domain-containing protein [Pseudoruegeria sp.]
MTDKIKIDPPLNTIRGLLQDVIERMDTLSAELRETDGALDVRPSDIRTLIHIVRKPRTLNDLSNVQGISRQAAHSSIKRLLEKGLIDFEFLEGSKRDKVAKMNQAGHALRTRHRHSFESVEKRIGDIIGTKELESLRRLLSKIAQEL